MIWLTWLLRPHYHIGPEIRRILYAMNQKTNLQRNAFLQHAFCLWLLLGCLVACGDGRSDGRVEGKLAVSVTVAPQAWLVERIAGDKVWLVTMVPEGQEPHSYQVTDVQVTSVARSAVYFRSGLVIESGRWFNNLTESESVLLVDLRSGVSLRKLDDHHGHDHHGHDHHAHEQDPHIWLSPRRLMIQAKTVYETLRSLDPRNASVFESNYKKLISEIKSVDQEIEKMLVPLKGKAFFIYHPAWGYFAEDYGLEQVAIEIEGKEPSDAELTALQAKARKLGVTTIFNQPQLSGKGAKAVADAIGAKVVTLDPLAPDVLNNLKKAADALVLAQSQKGKP